MPFHNEFNLGPFSINMRVIRRSLSLARFQNRDVGLRRHIDNLLYRALLQCLSECADKLLAAVFRIFLSSLTHDRDSIGAGLRRFPFGFCLSHDDLSGLFGFCEGGAA